MENKIDIVSPHAVAKLLFWAAIGTVIADIITTTYVVGKWGSDYEANVIMKLAFDEIGITSSMLIKLAISLYLIWFIIAGYLGELNWFYRLPIFRKVKTCDKSARQLSMTFFTMALMMIMFMSGVVFNNIVVIRSLTW